MAIAYKSAGAGGGTETSGAQLALACPAVVAANDILIGHVTHEGLTTAPTDPAGWTLLYGPANLGTGTAVGRSWAYGKLADGTEDGATINFGTAGGTAGRYGRIYSFDGYVSGTLAQLVRAASFSDIPTEGTIPLPTVTTTVTGAMAVALLVQDDNNAFAAAGAVTGGTWAEPVAEFVSTSLGVQGCVVGIQTSIPTTDPGTITGGTANATADEGSSIGFEIRPSPGSGYANFTGGSGQAVSTPDHADLDITGDIQLIVGAAFTATTKATSDNLITKADGGAQYSYVLRRGGGGRELIFGWKESGGTFRDVATTGGTFTAVAAAFRWYKVEFVASTATATFFFSDDPASTAVASIAWTNFGSDTDSVSTNIFSGTTPIWLGGRSDNPDERLDGDLYYAEVRNGVAGTIVANPDFREDCQQDSSTQLTDDQSRVWTFVSPATWATPLPCPGPAVDSPPRPTLVKFAATRASNY